MVSDSCLHNTISRSNGPVLYRLVLFLLTILTTNTLPNQPRIYPTLPSPRTHALYATHFTKSPELSLFSPLTSPSTYIAPGFAAIRGLNVDTPSTWLPLIDQYTNSTSNGGFDLANILWPGYSVVFSPNWPALATLLRSRNLLLTDLGGFVPGGMQDFILSNVTAPLYNEGRVIMGDTSLGLDMGEQDVRYLWGYASHVTPLGPNQRFQSYKAFIDYSTVIELQQGGKIVALTSSVYAVHHWLKTGLYTLAGSETSQSNGNAQLLYAFVRGASKQYGTLWYGQVSIFNCFGYKIPEDPNPSASCTSQSDHSPTCGTSLNLMKRLMYSQLAYNSAYFAFEGQWFYQTNGSLLTPIGKLQQSAKSFFSNLVSTIGTPGVHLPNIAVMLDYYGGWTRPCDTGYFDYKAASWGTLPWDSSDYFADTLFNLVYPGYRRGARMHDETGYQSPTPYGDILDVLLSDALPSVLDLYDTIILGHRAVTESSDLSYRLTNYVNNTGGKVFLTVSTLMDLNSMMNDSPPFMGISVDTNNCTTQPPGTVIMFSDGTNITESLAFTLCTLLLPPSSTSSSSSSSSSSLSILSWTVLATVYGTSTPVAVQMNVGNGTVTIVSSSNYGISTEPNPNGGLPYYGCGIDEIDTPYNQPYAMVQYVQYVLETYVLHSAALFDLGTELAWVPQQEQPGVYRLTITNPSLNETTLTINPLIGSIDWIQVLPTDESEKTAVGYFPHGYENVPIGNTTNTTIAGGDTLIVRIAVSNDQTRPVSPLLVPPVTSLWAQKRLLRLPYGISDIRRAILQRSQFDATYKGVVIDFNYVYSRSIPALTNEAVWLMYHNVTIMVDFSSVTTLFPGLRLVNDMGNYYQESLSMLEETITKMSYLGATDILIALHGCSEIPPSNFSTNTPVQTSQSVAETLTSLTALANSLNISIHLRRSTRNYELVGTGLMSQVNYATSVNGLLFAPSLAFCDSNIGGDETSKIISLFQQGISRIFLVSAPWITFAGTYIEGGPINPNLSSTLYPVLQSIHAIVMNITTTTTGGGGGGWIIMDTGYGEEEDSVTTRTAELRDVRRLEEILLAGTV